MLQFVDLFPAPWPGPFSHSTAASIPSEHGHTGTSRKDGKVGNKFRIDSKMPVGFKTVGVNDGTM